VIPLRTILTLHRTPSCVMAVGLVLVRWPHRNKSLQSNAIPISIKLLFSYQLKTQSVRFLT